MKSGIVLLAQVCKAGEADVSFRELGCKFVVAVKWYPSAHYLLIISCITIFCLASFSHRLHESGDNRSPKGTHCWMFFLRCWKWRIYRKWPKFQEQQMENDSKVCQPWAAQSWCESGIFLAKSDLMDGFNRTVDSLKCQEIFLFWIFVYFVI